VFRGRRAMARRAKLAPSAPAFVTPLQPRQVAELPRGDWLYEIKWDGYRALAIKDGDNVRIIPRNEKDLTAQFPGLVAAVSRSAAKTAVIDGEIVALDDKGRPSFQELQNRKAAGAGPVMFFAFDLLHLNGKEMHAKPIEDRRAQLAKVVGDSGVILSGELTGDVDAMVSEASKLGLEGIVAKRRGSPYVSGESSSWVKFKINRGQEFVVGGYEPPVNAVSALVLGYYEGSRLMFAGRVRSGFNTVSRRYLSVALRERGADVCPFANLPQPKHGRWGEGVTKEDMDKIQWVTPEIVVQVEFTEWTRAGVLRHARFKGIRDDKAARKVVRES